MDFLHCKYELCQRKNYCVLYSKTVKALKFVWALVFSENYGQNLCFIYSYLEDSREKNYRQVKSQNIEEETYEKVASATFTFYQSLLTSINPCHTSPTLIIPITLHYLLSLSISPYHPTSTPVIICHPLPLFLYQPLSTLPNLLSSSISPFSILSTIYPSHPPLASVIHQQCLSLFIIPLPAINITC